MIGTDLGALAQRKVGTGVTFAEIGIEEAEAEARRFADMIKSLPQRLESVLGGPNLAALHGANLAGHAVNATDAATWQTEPKHDKGG